MVGAAITRDTILFLHKDIYKQLLKKQKKCLNHNQKIHRGGGPQGASVRDRIGNRTPKFGVARGSVYSQADLPDGSWVGIADLGSSLPRPGGGRYLVDHVDAGGNPLSPQRDFATLREATRAQRELWERENARIRRRRNL